MADKNVDAKSLAEEAMGNEEKLTELAESLSGSSRRMRQTASAALAIIARSDAESLIPHVDPIIDALNRPEGQTRWEVLDILTMLVPYDSRACDKAIPGAETALFDEDSGLVRLAAVRFLCTLGATTEARSEKIWPLLDEGIQCYHGDIEFQDMLIAIVDFASGKLTPEVKASLKDRLKFDAENGKGILKKRSQQIIDNAS